MVLLKWHALEFLNSVGERLVGTCVKKQKGCWAKGMYKLYSFYARKPLGSELAEHPGLFPKCGMLCIAREYDMAWKKNSVKIFLALILSKANPALY